MVTRPPGSQASLHEANVRRVVAATRDHGSPTQAEIGRATGLSPATVSNIVRELRDRGLVEVAPTARGGRRAQAVSLNRSAGLAVGIDFGHSHLRVAVSDLAHDVIGEEAIPLDVDSSVDEGLDHAERLMKELLTRLGARTADVVGVGLGVPGPIEATSGNVGSSSILPGWVGTAAGSLFAERAGVTVHVDNDANLGALGEVRWGAAEGAADVAYIKLGTGVGAGLVLGGRLYRGAAGTAGELGHMSVDEGGPVCRCGSRGCLETHVGAPFLLSLLRGRHGDALRIGDVVRLAEEGDPGCRRVLADAGRYVGTAVANLCNLLNPSVVVVGGDLAEAGPLLLEPIRAGIDRFAVPGAASAVRVARAELGPRAEVLGAVALALQEADLPVVDSRLGVEARVPSGLVGR